MSNPFRVIKERMPAPVKAKKPRKAPAKKKGKKDKFDHEVINIAKAIFVVLDCVDDLKSIWDRGVPYTHLHFSAAEMRGALKAHGVNQEKTDTVDAAINYLLLKKYIEQKQITLTPGSTKVPDLRYTRTIESVDWDYLADE